MRGQWGLAYLSEADDERAIRKGSSLWIGLEEE